MRLLSLLTCLLLTSSLPSRPSTVSALTGHVTLQARSSSPLLAPRRAAAGPSWAKDRTARAAVRIFTLDKAIAFLGQPQGRGNGVLTDKGVVTCWHVVKDAETVYVIGRDGAMRRAASWSRVGSGGDLALVVGESLGGSEDTVEVAGKRPFGPTQAECFGFWGVGHSAGTPFRIQAYLFPGGQVPPSVAEIGGEWICGCFPLMPGMSGSGVYVDGQLVALCSMTPADGHGNGHVYLIRVAGL